MATTELAEAITALDVGYVFLRLSWGTSLNVINRFISNCCIVAAGGEHDHHEHVLRGADLHPALYYYDRCLAFSREVDLIWSRQNLSVATALYLLTQVSMAVYEILDITDMAITGCEVRNSLFGSRALR